MAKVREKMPREQHSVLYRYLRSYLLVFSLPLMLSLLLMSYYTNLYREEIIDNHYEQIKQIGITIDSQIEQVGNAFLQISSDTAAVPGTLEKGLEQIRASKEFSIIRQGNMAIHELIYFQKNIPCAISSRLVIDLGTIDKFHMHYPLWPKEQMISDIYTARTRYWRPFEWVENGPLQKREVMTGIFPMPVTGKYNAGVLLVQIEKGVFERLVGVDTYASGSLAIYSRGGVPLYHSDELPWGELLADYGWAGDFRSFEKDGYFITQVRSQNSDWYYLHAFPLKQAMSKVERWQLLLTVFTLGVLAMGFVLIYMTTMHNYRPVKELQRLISASDLSVTPVKDEIALAKLAITHLNGLSAALEEKLTVSQPHIYGALFLELLQGRYASVQEFNARGAAYGLTLRGRGVFAVAVLCAQAPEKLCEHMQSLLNKTYDIHPLSIGREDQQIFLCAREDADAGQVLADFGRLAGLLAKDGAPGVCIGISNETQDLRNVYRACVEALVAMGHATPLRQPVCLFARDDFRYSLYYPFAELDVLRNSLEQGDSEHFTDIFDSLYDYVENLDAASFIRPCVSYEIINCLLRVVLRHNQNVFPLEIMEKYSTLSLDRTLDHSEATLDVMRTLRDQVLSAWGREAAMAISDLDKIRHFVELHYRQRDFSAQMVADYMGMSLSALSTFFKKETKMTLSQFVTTKKMNYITDLLRHTDMSTGEIADLAGYASPSSFIRKFKQYMGMTPGEYKKAHERRA